MTTLAQIYSFFKPLPETNVYGSISQPEKDGDFVNVHWQYSDRTVVWRMEDGEIVFNVERVEDGKR